MIMGYKTARWNVTDRCNFSCAYCNTPNKHVHNPDELALEEIQNHLIPSLKEANVWDIILLGGEPMVREDIIEIIRLLRENYFGVVLVTNGSLLTRENCLKLLNLKLTRIHISFDSYLPEINKKTRISQSLKDTYITQLEAIRFFGQSSEVPLLINTVVNSINYQSIPDLIDFLSELGVQQVNLIPEGRKEGKNYSYRKLSFAELLELGKKIDQKVRELSNFKIEPLFLPLRAKKYLNEKFNTNFSMSATGGICKPGVHEIIIHSDGTILPCNAFLTDDPDLLTYFEINSEAMKASNTPVDKICKSRTYEKAYQVSQTQWYRYSLRPCGKCEFLNNGCFPCVFPRLKDVLHKKTWEPIIIQPFCQYISKLENEEFNQYKINSELIWHQEQGQLSLYNPTEVEILTLSGYQNYLWTLLLKGYTDMEMINEIYQKYKTSFKNYNECQKVVLNQIDEWSGSAHLYKS